MTNIYENITRVYYALYEQMNEVYSKGATDIQSTREAERIAQSLIKNDDLPLLIRCRALCILGSFDKGDYLRYAEESVHYARLGLASDTIGSHEGDDDGQLILKCCEECLEGAKAAAAEAGTGQALDSEDEMEDSEESGVQEDDDDDDDEGEVVWDPAWDDERKAKAIADHAGMIAAISDNAAKVAEGQDEVREAKPLPRGEADAASLKATKKKVKNVRRTHSGDTDNDPEFYEEYDLTIGAWVEYGTAVYPEMLLR
jgi:hypothetical protein